MTAEQRRSYVHNLSFIVDPTKETAKVFLEYIEKFNVDLDPENDKDFEIFGQPIFTPSVELISSSSIMIQFVTEDKPLDKEGFSLLPIHYDCIKSMICDCESTDEQGEIYMWFGGEHIFREINKAFFILKKIDALRITDAPDSYEEVALLIDEPERVVKFVLQAMEVPLEKLPSTNFRPKIRDNEYFKRLG